MASLMILLLIISHSLFAAPQSLRVAVASNFASTAKQLFTVFEQQQNISIDVSSGSTGALYAQILHGAPFDLFLSADAQRPQLLDEKGLVVPATRLPYAAGQLALWDSNLAVTTPTITVREARALLNNPRRLSIANPVTAPYGNAAQQVLKRLDIWPLVAPHLIQGNSVLQAYQFVETANVSRGLVAYHLVKSLDSAVIIPAELYSPIEQYMVVLSNSKNIAAAQQLQGFLSSEFVQNQLVELGYGPIERPFNTTAVED